MFQVNENNINLLSTFQYIRNQVCSKWEGIKMLDKLINRKFYFIDDQTNEDNYQSSDESDTSSASIEVINDKMLDDEYHKNIVDGITNLQLEICQNSLDLKLRKESLIQDWQENLKNVTHLPIRETIEIVENFKDQLYIIQTEFRNLQINKETLELSKPFHYSKSIREIKSIITDNKALLKSLFDLYEQEVELNEILKSRFIDFNESLFDNKFKTIFQQFQSKMKSDVILSNHHAHLMNHFKYVENILKTMSLSYRLLDNKIYWAKLEKKLNLSGFDFQNSTTEEVYHMMNKLNPNAEEIISDLVDFMHSEIFLKEQLLQIQTKWNEKAFQLAQTNHENLYVICNYDQIFEECTESINILSANLSSPYVTDIQTEVAKMKTELENIFSKSSNLKACQQFVMQYIGIFKNENNEIQRNFTREIWKFKRIYENVSRCLSNIKYQPKVIEINRRSMSLEIPLEVLIEDFDPIRASVGLYINEQRNKFGRFYFIEENELLDILGCSVSPEHIQKHISKIFQQIKSVHYSNGIDCFLINSVECTNGEILRLHQPVSILKSSKMAETFSILEKSIQKTLSNDFERNIAHFLSEGIDIFDMSNVNHLKTIKNIFSQNLLLLEQIIFTKLVESSIILRDLPETLQQMEQILSALSKTILLDLIDGQTRNKLTILINEIFHQKSVVDTLLKDKVISIKDSKWTENLRFYFNDGKAGIKIGFLNFDYKYDIHGISMDDFLVRTPLVNKCFLSITDARRHCMGSLLFGPAGTGKTENIKQLARYLGRMVMVFNCGETFTEESFRRILIGASNIGSWVCFDEFNRLSRSNLLCALNFIDKIQSQLQIKNKCTLPNFTENLIHENIAIHRDTLIVLTMNKNYKGRIELPDKIYDLFRPFSVNEPDTEIITKVLIHIQGFRRPEIIATKILYFFQYCRSQIIYQDHYDFGLRIIKSVIDVAGIIYKERFKNENQCSEASEETCIVEAIKIIILPRLVVNDLKIVNEIMEEIFIIENRSFKTDNEDLFENTLLELFPYFNVYFSEKLKQLHHMLKVYQSVIIYGESGSGKTLMWNSLVEIYNKIDNESAISSFVLNPTVINFKSLFGHIDESTFKWHDGLLPILFRKANFLNEMSSEEREKNSRRQLLWIIFDGSVSSNWIENLNSLFDNTKSLSLSNGERIKYPEKGRIIIETDSIINANPSTISRCGILYLDIKEAPRSYLKQLLYKFKQDRLLKIEKTYQLGEIAVQILMDLISKDNFILELIDYSSELSLHIMGFRNTRSLKSFLEYLEGSFPDIIKLGKENPSQLEIIITRFVIQAIRIATMCDADNDDCGKMTRKIQERFPLAALKMANLDEYWLSDTGQFVKICDMKLNTDLAENISLRDMNYAKVVISTDVSVKVKELIKYSLKHQKQVIFCGPPGTGKSMTIVKHFDSFPQMKIITYNLTCDTSPHDIIRLFDTHCIYEEILTKSSKFGVQSSQLLPKYLEIKQLIFFFDEINLQKLDDNNIQQTSFFLRELFEKRIFYHDAKNQEIIIPNNITFIAACNPPNNGDRLTLPNRLLHNTLVVYIDSTSRESLLAIYGDILKHGLKQFAIFPSISYDKLANDSVDIFLSVLRYFKRQPHSYYLCTLRDFSRWIFTFLQSINTNFNNKNLEVLEMWSVVGLHVFGDRSVTMDDLQFLQMTFESYLKEWSEKLQPVPKSLSYVTYFNKNLTLTEKGVITKFEVFKDIIKRKLEIFTNYGIMTDQIYDLLFKLLTSVTKKSTGNNVMLIGNEGSGREYVCDLVSRLCDLPIIKMQLVKSSKVYDFEEELRKVIRVVIFENTKVIVVIKYNSFQTSNIIEKASPLLSQGDICNLFEEEEYLSILRKAKEINNRHITEKDLLSCLIQERLKFILIVNSEILKKKNKIINSQAILNRCHVIWFANWNDLSYHEATERSVSNVITKLTNGSRLYPGNNFFPTFLNRKEDIISQLIKTHKIVEIFLSKDSMDLTPFKIKVTLTNTHFIRFLETFDKLIVNEFKWNTDQHSRLKQGSEILRNTMEGTAALERSLQQKAEILSTLQSDSVEKLKKISHHQMEAKKLEMKFRKSHKDLQKQESEISVKKKELDEKISQQEKELEEAQADMRKLERKQIFELKSMRNPPAAVKLACEAVCDLLEEKVYDWRGVLGVILKDNFVSRIFNFNWGRISFETRQEMIKKYLQNPDYTVENVTRACISIGPVVKWTKAQLNLADTLEKIEPLRKVWNDLDTENSVKNDLTVKCHLNILDIQRAVQSYEKDNSGLKIKIEQYQNEINEIQLKISTAKNLTNLLIEEYNRWLHSIKSWNDNPMNKVIEILLASAIICYTGHLDLQQKQVLLDKLGKDCFSNLKVKESSKTISQIISKLELNGIIDDNKYTENERTNMIIFQESNACPLIIDPGSVGINILKSNKVIGKDNFIETSFIDKDFHDILRNNISKNLTLIINHAEYFNPIIIPIIRKSSNSNPCFSFRNEGLKISSKLKIILMTQKEKWIVPSELSVLSTVISFSENPCDICQPFLEEIVGKFPPDISLISKFSPIEDKHLVDSAILEKENNLLNFIIKKKDLLNNQEIVNTIMNLKKDLMDSINKRECYMKIHEIYKDKYQKYSLMLDTLGQINTLLIHVTQWCSSYKFNFRMMKSFLNKFIEDKITNSSINVEELCTLLLKNCFSYFSQFIQTCDHLAFAFNLCFIMQTVVKKKRESTEEKLWNILKDLLKSTDISKSFQQQPNQNIQTLMNLFKEYNIDLLLLKHELFQNLVKDNDFLNISDNILQCLHTLTETERLLFMVIISLLFQPQLLECSLQIFILKIMDVDLRNTFLKSCIDNLESILLKHTADFEPIVILRSKETNPITVLKVIQVNNLSKHPNLIIRRISMIDLISMEKLKAAINAIRTRPCWIVIDNNDSTVEINNCDLDFTDTNGNTNFKLIADTITMFKQIFQSNPEIKLVFTANINSNIPDQLLTICKPVLMEFEIDFKTSMLHNFDLYFPKYNFLTDQQSEINFQLLLFHSILQMKANEPHNELSLDYCFNDIDYMCAVNAGEMCYKIESSNTSESDSTSQSSIVSKHSMNKKNLLGKYFPNCEEISEIPFRIKSLLINSIYGGKMSTETDKIFVEHLYDTIFNRDPIKINKKPNGTTVTLRFPKCFKLVDLLIWIKNIEPDFINQFSYRCRNSNVFVNKAHLISKRLKNSLLFSQLKSENFNQTSSMQRLEELIKLFHYEYLSLKKIMTSSSFLNLQIGTRKYFYRELMFGYRFVEEIDQSFQHPQSENENTKLVTLKHSLETDTVDKKLQTLCPSVHTSFNKWTEYLFTRMKGLVTFYQKETSSHVPLKMLFHPDLFVISTQLETARETNAVFNNLRLYLTKPNCHSENISWTLTLFNSKYNNVSENYELVKEKFTAFWKSEKFMESKCHQKASCYVRVDNPELVFNAIILFDNSINIEENEYAPCQLYICDD